jgi:DNA processing protein
MTEHESFVALNLATGWGPITVARLMDGLGSARAIVESRTREWVEAGAGISPERAGALRDALDAVDVADELDRARRLGVTLLSWVSPEYPPLLKAIADPPLALYVRGSLAALSAPCVAMVGTRHATVYGRETARRLAYQVAAAGYVVVSGLARGIDTEAHRGAVQAKGRTIGVLGGALDRFFPRENIELAASIVENGGAIVSEFPFGMEPDKTTFPRRNRVVSGLSRGTVAIEAPLRSGTLITTSQALEQDRAVMAVPGPVDSPSSAGCHQLIRAGARLVSTADEILEELDDLAFGAARRVPQPGPAPPPAPSPPLSTLSPDERRIVQALENGPEHVDAIVRVTGLAAGKVGALVTGLQIKRLVKLLPGGMVSLAK